MDKKDLAMDTRKAIFDFQYSEKMKSGLVIGTNLLEQLVALKGEGELSGGRKVLTWYLEGLLRELRIAQNVIGMDHYVNLERDCWKGPDVPISGGPEVLFRSHLPCHHLMPDFHELPDGEETALIDGERRREYEK